MAYHFPELFRQKNLEGFGEHGSQWLDNLPTLLDTLAERWALRLLAPFPLSYNYVAPAIRADGTQVALKVGCPHDELMSEIHALEHYAGHGIVRALEVDREHYAMLLEWLQPGTTLAELKDDDAMTRITAQVMKDLWVPAPVDPQLMTIEIWASDLGDLRATFGGGTGPFPETLVDRANGIFTELLADPHPQVLLHGDLHHENILAAERAPWLAIDPKGVIGEAEFEVGPLMLNQWDDHISAAELRRLSERRLAIFSEMLGFDLQRLRAWTIARGVLSSWWTYQDHKQRPGIPALFLAEVLSQPA